MIRFDSVTKGYPDGTLALNNLSFEAATGKITVVVGPSGCGKTTLLRVMNRMVEPDSGRVWLGDRDTATIVAHELRRSIGYVSQQAGLFSHRTVLDNIATVPLLTARTRRQARARAAELLEVVGLPAELGRRYPAQLSGGQAQRVGVARALAADPPVLLMDEPFNAVDRILSAVVTFPLLAALGACGAPGSSAQLSTPRTKAPAVTAATGPLPAAPGSVIIGAADFPESELLADLYAGAMKARGVHVHVHADIGERAAYFAALKDGSIGAVPEYSGAVLDYLSPANTARSRQDIYHRLRAAAGGQQLTVTACAPAQDADTVTGATARKYRLKNIGDLKAVAHQLKLGAPAPTQTLPYGLPALKKVYGVHFGQFVPLAPTGAITQSALRNGTVDAADIFSTGPVIRRYGFVSLKDPEHIFPAENVVPLFRRDVLTRPMADACDAVSAKLTTTTLAELDSRVVNGAGPAAVATAWLTANGLAR